MGKKSRLKRERRAKKSVFFSKRKGKHDNDDDLILRESKLCDLFSRYNAEDVLISLGVSELWPPNISGQVKHHFALGVFASMEMGLFNSSNRLSIYSDFCDFIQAVHATLPNFPFLEDFIPESDWGDIRIRCKDSFLKIFYGGSVERIPDFIEAFRLRNETRNAALNDMDLAITMQHRVISQVDQEAIGEVKDIHPGHVEVPSQSFWLQCREALFSACEMLSPIEEKISPTLVVALGELRKPTALSSFSDAFMNGTSLPAVIVRVGDKLLPISPRNATSVVIDLWGEDAGCNFENSNLSLSGSVANFLTQRLSSESVIVGPLKLISRASKIPHRIAAVVKNKHKLYLIIVLDAESLQMLDRIEQEIMKLIANSRDWALLLEGRGQAMQLRRADGTLPQASDIEILVVLSRVATSWMRLPLVKTSARVMSLPDFVTIFDSLNNAEELDEFWEYVDNNESLMNFMLSGVADLFGSFRDSNALLLEGALTPNIISLDPHWGCNWRYRVLREFWLIAPHQFPDDTPAWVVASQSDGLQSLIAKGVPTLAWSTRIDDCTFQVMFRFLDQDLDVPNGQILELFVNCLADGINQRRSILMGHPLFRRSQIVLLCYAQTSNLVAETEDERIREEGSKPLFGGWAFEIDQNTKKLSASVEVNIARIILRLNSPCDASFEAECVIEGIKGLLSLVGLVLDPELISRLLATSSRRPRFTLTKTNRTVDVPDFSQGNVPTPKHYKIARRDLAVVFKKLGVEPGHYQLAQAKEITDPARDELRAQVHDQIATFDRKTLLLYCAEQHDALTSEYQREEFRITQSLKHEVTYNRSERLAEAHDKYTRESRNYRYLLECCISGPKTGSAHPTSQECVQLVATIDWLFVLYSASDVLHNNIDAAGVVLNDSFIPQVFYSEDSEEKKKEFSMEMADVKLGIDLLQEDEVNSVQEEEGDFEALDQAFLEDLGFSFSHLTQVLLVLAQWKTISGDAELRLSYQASFSRVVDIMKETIHGLKGDEAKLLVDFVTLDPINVRRLLGKNVNESDVPVWEHNKRSHRYTIRPLIPIGEGLLAWGAAAADRAARIWLGSISNGYLPADFDWPYTKEAVRNIKAGLERQLEVRAYEVCSRATPNVMHGIDFKYRFPRENLEDVGDFDVLAYWPDANQWLAVECKYNQPPFCLKDARRLRDRIFGSGSKRGQFGKIERRRRFLSSQLDRLRKLLGWPEPSNGSIPLIREIYVSRTIYWWMRNPPFEVPTEFVRIDGLDLWLRSKALLVNTIDS